jgi:geranylgeranyl reductase family protein
VVGGGPAGSTTAYRLASAGASVLVLDRAAFPRDKPCGGGVTVRAARLLPFSIGPVVEDAIDVVELRLGRRSHEHRCSEPIVLMTQRRRLDAFLLERAAEAGAEVREAVRVTGIEGTTVRTASGSFRATAVIGADGVNGISARALGLASNPAYGVALEADLRGVAGYRGRIVFELCVARGGYGWIFPKGDHLNVGVGGWAPEAGRLRTLLLRFCRERGLPADRLEGIRGYRLPVGRRDARLAQGQTLVVGDAAGLVDPLSGDGIYEALLSGRLASESVLDLLAGPATTLEAYDTRVRAALARNLATSWAAKRALDRFPQLLFTAARTGTVQRALERLARGDAQPTFARHLGRPALLAAGLLARDRSVSLAA